MDIFTHWLAHYGYIALFLLLMFGNFGFPAPEETLLTFAGVLVYRGHLQFVPAVIVAFLGCSCGVTLSFLLGETVGYRLIMKYGRYLRITPDKLDAAHAWFDRAGHWSLLVGYFFPGIRHLMAIIAGVAKLSYPVFAIFAYAGALLWSFTFISLGVFVGGRWNRVAAQIHDNLLIVSLVIAAGLLIAFIFRMLLKRRQENIVK